MLGLGGSCSLTICSRVICDRKGLPEELGTGDFGLVFPEEVAAGEDF